eukprot:TRINITY_DN9450_c0_g1_i5.p2 TRINITY_DN9450_c0_g1~~TRINITY_DN9450_c0_g1_i5.p2  ORF type:complete len:227 (-),score=11.44 TRINITY_DN9450_c0_g1_i5:4257-4937(-)
MTIERVLVCVPLPHVWLHVPQVVQFERTQSTGQGSTLQVRVSFKSGHATPPFDVSMITLRFLDIDPPPHTAVHGENSDHSVTVQSTGQGLLLQACSSLNCGHWLPPYCGCTEMERWRTCLPPPQLTEQFSHAPQLSTTQSIGHSCVLHGCVSVSEPAHSVPPYCAGVTTVRLRLWLPDPQVAVHVLQSVHDERVQLTGHGNSLQACFSDSEGHGFPPYNGCTVIFR